MTSARSAISTRSRPSMISPMACRTCASRGARRLRPGLDRAQSRRATAARARGAVVGGVGLRQFRVQLGDAALAAQRERLRARRGRARRRGTARRRRGRGQPRPRAFAHRPSTISSTQRPRPSETRPPSPVHSRVVHARSPRFRDAGGLRDLDLALALVERLGHCRGSARSRCALPPSARRPGRPSKATAASSSRNARGRGRGSVMRSASQDLAYLDRRRVYASLGALAKEDRGMKVEGACHCGRIAFEAEIDPARVSVCHCADCQTLTGSAFRLAVPGAGSEIPPARRGAEIVPEDDGRQRPAARAGVLRRLRLADLCDLARRRESDFWAQGRHAEAARPARCRSVRSGCARSCPGCRRCRARVTSRSSRPAVAAVPGPRWGRDAVDLVCCDKGDVMAARPRSGDRGYRGRVRSPWASARRGRDLEIAATGGGDASRRSAAGPRSGDRGYWACSRDLKIAAATGRDL